MHFLLLVCLIKFNSQSKKFWRIQMRFFYGILFWLMAFFAPAFCSAETIDIQKQSADIISDGIRISADIYRPKSTDQNRRFPAVIMSHGWGGVASHLSETASDIARAGFVVVAIDYRGWGKSDARLIQVKDKDGKYSKTRELREVVDPLDQAEDIFNAINWAASDSQVDSSKIGLWGTSFSGGLVVYVAARDKRIKALVSQVAGMGWGLNQNSVSNDWHSKGGQRARGRLDYPSPGAKEVGELRGGMIWEKLARFRPIDDASMIKNAASLFIVAQNEELLNNKEHSLAAFEKITTEKDYIEIPNIKHYDIYGGNHRKTATRLAITWYERHLKGVVTDSN
jgi:acetyl esterase/lipase